MSNEAVFVRMERQVLLAAPGDLVRPGEYDASHPSPDKPHNELR